MNPLNTIKRQQIQAGVAYKAMVLENDDSKHEDGKKLGRVRVKVFGIVDNLESDEHYPWAIPDWSHTDGSTKYSGMFDVPKKNSVVSVRFQPGPDGAGSIYHPVYSSAHQFEPNVIEDSDHHYPNRKVHRTSNGYVVIVDTEDDSLHIYNPGEVHAKSAGKMTIKCEETMVIISDVEIGLRAPEIAIRAKDHLMLESMDKMTIRSNGDMNIESRANIRALAKKDVEWTTAEGHMDLQVRCDKGPQELFAHSKLGDVRIHAEGGKGKIELESKEDKITAKAKTSIESEAGTHIEEKSGTGNTTIAGASIVETASANISNQAGAVITLTAPVVSLLASTVNISVD